MAAIFCAMQSFAISASICSHCCRRRSAAYAVVANPYSTPARSKRLIDAGVDFSRLPPDGVSLLLRGAASHSPEMMRYLLECLSPKPADLTLALHQVAKRGMNMMHHRNVSFEREFYQRDNVAAITRMLLARGADVHARTRHGNDTALHLAASIELGPVVPLLEHGADLEARNADGETPLLVAARR